MKRALLAVLTLTIALCLVTASSATTWHPLRSVITIAGGPPSFHGHVRLRKRHSHHRAQVPCRSHRVVRLWRINPSGHHAKLIGQTLTTRRGNWRVTAHPNSGTYVAKVRRKSVLRNHVLCRSAHTRFVREGHG